MTCHVACCHVRGMLPIASVGCMLMYRGEKSFFSLPYSHLYLLQSLLAQQEWRTPSLQSRLLEYLKPHFIHPFKNVRERIGRYCTSCTCHACCYLYSSTSSMLAQMHAYELPTFQVLYNPRRKDTVRDIDAMLPSADQIKNTDSMRLSKTGRHAPL